MSELPEDLTVEPVVRPEHDGRRQVEFHPMQTHSRRFEIFMLAFSILCVVVVLVIVLGTDIGNLNR
jgi:hypothetical protein